MKNLVVIQLLTDQIDNIRNLLGVEWPYFEELLITLQYRITSKATDVEINGNIEAIINSLLASPAKVLIAGIVDKADEAEQIEEKTTRSVGKGNFPNINLAESSKIILSINNLTDKIINAHVEGFEIIPVYYATDRLFDGDPLYGSERGSLVYGRTAVSIPASHKTGNIERPKWWKFELNAAPESHVVVLECKEYQKEAFFSEITHTLEQTSEKSILVFIHGYNVTFAEAIRRTAQLAYDLDYPGIPVTYSWPSAASLLKYKIDENNIEWTIPHLQETLSLLGGISSLHHIDVIAHSMGNRALFNAIRSSWSNVNFPIPNNLRQVVLAAPDIDSGVFRNAVNELTGKAQRITLYASSKDRALKMSKIINGYPRAGDSGGNIVVLQNTIDTIDATEVDTNLIGHSYYGDNRSILSDVFNLFKSDSPPPRFGMANAENNGASYWVFRP
jgi:esterase/lipase superfamily enzyme